MRIRFAILGFGAPAAPPPVDANLIARLASLDKDLCDAIAANPDHRLVEAEHKTKRALQLLDPTHPHPQNSH